jgi:hypothetical protein
MASIQGSKTAAGLAAAVILLVAGAPARAGLITSGTSLSGLGSFSGSISYTDINATSATLTVSLTNTSSPKVGGFLTSFIFNNPGNDITGAKLTSGPANFSLFGASEKKGQTSYQDLISGNPFGSFDLGVTTDSKPKNNSGFEGGGKPSLGLGVGQTGVFTFTLTGHDLDTLTDASFGDAFSTGGGEGSAFFLARFRGFLNGGSDKVTGKTGTITPNVTPEPSTALLGAVGAGCLAGFRWLRRRPRRAA